MAKRTNTTKENKQFDEQIRLALNNFADPAWLTDQSPLAKPYFLGLALQENLDESDPAGNGKVLQKLLRQATDQLWPGKMPPTKEALVEAVQTIRNERGNKGVEYAFFLLELRYFRRYFRPRLYPRVDSERDIREYLMVGRGPYFNHLKTARRLLGEALLKLVQPTFRLEQPPLVTLTGREAAYNTCHNTLQANKTLSLSGMTGSGKTSLAATLYHRWSGPTFWYTLRPNFNDQLTSLLFTLAHRLHQQGASGLWRQLLAQDGQIGEINIALAQLRGDLAQLPQPLLLCFDELDLLAPDTIMPSQQPIRHLLTSLRGLAPILLISQRQPLPADVHHVLQGLSLPDTALLLKQADLKFTAEELRNLHRYTNGNPRLLQLCLTLSTNGQSLSETLAQLPQSPALHTILAHLWNQLSADERKLLRQLAIFRNPVPDDVWPLAVVDKLIQRRLVQRDGLGGLTLLPAIRDLVYHDPHYLAGEQSEQAHLLAAEIRATRGDYTASAYHYQQANEPAKAVQIWYAHRQQEIQRGQAETALRLFQQLSPRHLSPEEQSALSLIRAELHRLLGEMQEGLDALNQTDWTTDSEGAVSASWLRGVFLNELGYPQAALLAYDEGMQTAQRLLNGLIRFHYHRGITYLQQRETDLGQQEAQSATYLASHLRGLVAETQGAYEVAYEAFVTALEIARQTGNNRGVADMNRSLQRLLARQGKLAESTHYAEQAITHYEQMGDRFAQESVRSNLAVAFVQAGKFAEAIRVGEQSLAFFEAAGMTHYAAAGMATVAEAYYELGDFASAEAYAYRTIRQEETYPRPYALYTLGLVQKERGELTEAKKTLQTGVETAQGNGDKYIGAYLQRVLGGVLEELGDPAGAKLAIQSANTLFTELGLTHELEGEN